MHGNLKADGGSTAELRARKESHLDLVLAGAGKVAGSAAGFERVRFEHCALPELDLAAIDLTCRWLGRRLNAPLLISSMTGGPERAAAINRNLAEAAEELGIAFAVGSQRVSLSGAGDRGLDRSLREAAPSVPLLSNIGGAQLRERDGLDLARRAVETLEADALIVHLNPLQEALQPGGDTDWRGILARIGRLAAALPVPVVVKEVGAGIGRATALRLWEAGVRNIDVAGAGGTSWAAIEAGRARSAEDQAVAAPFAGWGVPTAEAIAAVRGALPDAFLIGSGGIRNGLDAAKAIRLGADLAGQAAGVLASAAHSTEAVAAHFRVVVAQLRIACFCTGSGDLAALRRAPLLPTPDAALLPPPAIPR
jgi:isopentenyl-diphosphate Delta-isomerase